jgi:hypothetical protein
MMAVDSFLSGKAASGPLSPEPVGASRGPGRETDPADAGAGDATLGFAELLAAALGLAPDPHAAEPAPAGDGSASDNGAEDVECDASGAGGAGMVGESGSRPAMRAHGFAGVSNSADAARGVAYAMGGVAIDPSHAAGAATHGDANAGAGTRVRPDDSGDRGAVGASDPSSVAGHSGAWGEAAGNRAARHGGAAIAGAEGATGPVPAPAAGAPAHEAREGAGWGAGHAAADPAAGAAHTADAAVSIVDRSMERLDPELRRRLDRVIDRMRDEFGHEVRLVEGYRDQRRQDHLYAQGRTRPGPVVTWTRSSAHTAGRAADLIVDGTFDNPTAYARLARIAREEGLSTIGPRDAGHVELPASEAASIGASARPGAGIGVGGGSAVRRDVGLAGASSADGARAARVQAVAPVARPAEVASVAAVAQVARVATVARVAGPGAAGLGGATTKSSAPTGGGVDAVERGNGRPGRSGGAAVESGSAPAIEMAAGAAFSAAGASPDGAIAVPGEVRGAGGADRVARVLELRDGAEARPLSQVLLRLDDLDAGEGRVRVGVRGSAVDARIDLGDPVLAGRLGARIDDLSRALRRHGLDPETLLVQASRASDIGEPARLAVAGVDAEPAWVRALRSLDGGAGAQGDRRHDAGRDSRSGEPDVSHQRSRKEHRREDRT